MQSKSKQSPQIGVIGAGSWGTTLAHLLAEKGFKVSLWVYEVELCRIMREKKVWLIQGHHTSFFDKVQALAKKRSGRKWVTH